jgi:hypothetical protein
MVIAEVTQTKQTLELQHIPSAHGVLSHFPDSTRPSLLGCDLLCLGLVSCSVLLLCPWTVIFATVYSYNYKQLEFYRVR